MNDLELTGLLAAIVDGDLSATLVLADLLEDRGDARAAHLRWLFDRLLEDWLFAPVSFAHFRVARQHLLPLFPEYLEESS